MRFASTFVVFGFSFIHMQSGSLRLDKENLISKFTSFVGGISIAYVLFVLIPSLLHSQEDIAETFHLTNASALQLVVGVLILGLLVFYYLERALESAKVNIFLDRLQYRNLSDQTFEQSHKRIFWVHIGSYAMYNLIIGILMADHAFETSFTAIFYLAVIGLHLFTNDWVLRHHFTDLYDRHGKLMISLAVVVGWLIGKYFHINHAVIYLLEAFVYGGLIFNALKDDLPQCRGNNAKYFILGTVFYSVLLHMI